MPGSNAANLDHSLQYLKRVVQARVASHYQNGAAPVEPLEPPELAYFDDASALGEFIKARTPTFDEYIVLLLALLPHVRPDFLDTWINEGLPESGNYPEIGGSRDNEKRILMPTGETAAFLLAGRDLDRRFEVQQLFTGDHWFARESILRLAPAKDGEPFLSGRLLLDPEHIDLFTLGWVANPPFSAAFPAREISTALEWDDLILAPAVREQIEEIKHWIEHHHTLLRGWGMHRRIRPGYRALFYGPPGTGKTLTATLLGKYTGKKVFRIDLSSVVSKYIGETEKNLNSLFDKAQNKDWVLFFDEADALFGKRTNVKDAHDRYANQEISYLLQRLEDFDGLVILASNLKSNMDDAFVRRFNAMIRFPFPDEAERAAIWRKSMPDNVRFENGTDLPGLLAKFELTGGNIINVVHHVCLKAIARKSKTLTIDDALKGIQREAEKEGKVFKNILV
jgi:AAA+ superfamily predicted ATPase